MSDFNTLHNRAVWFDIPVTDLDRACDFYRAVLAVEVTVETVEQFRFAVLEHDQGNGGCLVPAERVVSNDSGLLLYLNVDGRLQDAVEQVTLKGGEVLEPAHPIGPHGFRALIRDSEGNRLALHANLPG